MALIGAGIVDVNGNIIDVVRSVTCSKEASVTAGGTVSDSGTKYTAETHYDTASGNRIDMGTFSFLTSFTMAVRFVYRTANVATVYASLASRGSVFENDTQFAFGVRNLASAHFSYARNGGSLLGTEGSAYSLVDGTIYTILLRWQSGTQEEWLFGVDVGGASDNDVLLLSSSSGDASDGSQHIFIGGPNTVGVNDNSGNFGILGFLYYDTYLADAVLANIRDDFYGQIPSSTPTAVVRTPTFLTQKVG